MEVLKLIAALLFITIVNVAFLLFFYKTREILRSKFNLDELDEPLEKIRLQLFFKNCFWEKDLVFTESLWHNIREHTFNVGGIVKLEVFHAFSMDENGIYLVKVRPTVSWEEISDSLFHEDLLAEKWSPKNLF